MGKRLVLCWDGTWITPGQAVERHPCPTNMTNTALEVAEKGDAPTPPR